MRDEDQQLLCTTVVVTLDAKPPALIQILVTLISQVTGHS